MIATDDAALDVLRRHGDHPSAFLAYNQDTRSFCEPGIDGLVAYRDAGRRHVAQLLGPLASEQDRGSLLHAFHRHARASGRRIMSVQLRAEDVGLYVDAGFVVNQFGSSYSIDLGDYGLRGTRFMKVRNKISQARRAGVTIEELDPSDLEEPGPAAELDAIDAAWLRSKGAHANELAFMIGERRGRGRPHRRVLLARHGERPVAYVTYSPCFGQRPGWLYDLTRRHPEAPNGTIEALFNHGAELLRDEGCEWLHLGLTPFTGLAAEHEPRHGSSRAVRTVVEQIAHRGYKLYPAATQESFKRKWQPQVVEPEYIAFERGVSLRAIWKILRLTRTVAL